jgi:ABC-2 type transport system ATP-binding protein
VDDLSLEVAAGSVFGFLGPNGAGKTTSIRLLLGLIEPSAGRLEVLGYDVRTNSIEGRIRELLDPFELWDRRKEYVTKWSRNMKQKLAIARSLMHRPPLLFLDEPTAGLDPVVAAAIREHLAALAKGSGTTIFLTTHNLTEAEKLCGRIAVIRKGKLAACGTPAEVKGSHQTLESAFLHLMEENG